MVGSDINVENLYHGTTAPLDMICEEGLDTRLSHKGHFGQGIYFRYAMLDCDRAKFDCWLECCKSLN